LKTLGLTAGVLAKSPAMSAEGYHRNTLVSNAVLRSEFDKGFEPK